VVQGDSERLDAALAIVRQATVRLAALTDRFPPDGGTWLRAVADRLYSERRKRDSLFPPGLFGEPAWDLLLALFVAHEDGRELSFAESYEAAKIDPREGPALIDRLASAGLVLRSRAQRDRWSHSVVLTDHAVERLSDYLTDLI
jgi:DNA-binding MarR family transcriptional regulator